MMIIGFCNLKGGVGKTTSCQNIAAALKKAGKKIAVVDMDPQSNLSAGFGISPSPTDPQVFDLLSGAAEWDDIIARKEGIDIIPSSLNLVMAELNDDGPIQRRTALRDALSKIEADRYDYILLDSPPQLGIFTQNVLAACNKIIVPMDGGFYSLFGLRLLDRSMGTFRERINPELEIGGIIMTNYNPRLYISRKIYEEVRKSFRGLLFESYIRQNVSIVEASSMGMSIFEYEPKSKGAECYRIVAQEFMRRFEGETNGETPVPDEAEPSTPLEKLQELIRANEAESQSENSEIEIVMATENPEFEFVPEEPEIEPVIEIEIPETESPAPESEHETDSEVPETEEPVTDSEPETEPEIPETEPPAEEPEPPAVIAESEPEDSPYVQSIKQAVIDMLPESEKPTWTQLLKSVHDVSRGEIDVRLLRDDFEDSDKDRFTFYVLNDESDTFWPVMYPDQIIEPLRCVMKWDENGAVEVYM